MFGCALRAFFVCGLSSSSEESREKIGKCLSTFRVLKKCVCKLSFLLRVVVVLGNERDAKARVTSLRANYLSSQSSRCFRSSLPLVDFSDD